MKDFLNWETISTILIALLIGMLLGIFYNTKYSIGFRTFMRDMYIKVHPEVKKDSKTIIIDQVTKNTQNVPQKDIFEAPKKENKLVIFIKRVYGEEKPKRETIYDNY